ncbi:MAG: hypothetical protein WCB05_22125, partial [Candidatus Sulfotelmatobacter sp.]
LDAKRDALGIFIADADGSNPKELTSGTRDDFAACAPDGKIVLRRCRQHPAESFKRWRALAKGL